MPDTIESAARRFAVFLPNYNHGRHLPQALDALLMQSVQPREICVLDDGSTDNSPSIIADYAARYPHIRPIYLEHNRGLLENLSYWLAQASDEFLFFAAADDMTLPSLFASSLKLLIAYPEAGLCSASSRLMDQAGRDLGPFPTPKPLRRPGYLSPHQASRQLMISDTWMMGNTTVYRASPLREAGGFRPSLLGLSDGYASRIIALKYGACFIPSELAYWRQNEVGFAASTYFDLNKAKAITDVACLLMTTEHSALFPRGYAERWRGRWLFGSLIRATRHTSDPPTANLRQALSPLNAFDWLILSTLDRLSLGTWPLMAYAFLRLRPRDLPHALFRRVIWLLRKSLLSKKNTYLLSIDSHFSFGHNWRSFSGLIDETRIKTASESVARLYGPSYLNGKRVLDIGSGSGIFSVAVLRLGASTVRAIDIDPESVRTTELTLETFCRDKTWSCDVRSIFEMAPEQDGTYDAVYSWGVLHHTGDMEGAISIASRLITPEGRLVIGLYKKTPFCGFWRWEKQLYAHGPHWLTFMIRALYKGLYCIGLMITGRNPRTYIANYVSNRGMDWDHDVNDWLGGYPYESISDAEMELLVARLKFRIVKRFTRPVPAAGLFGSLIVEYVLERATPV